MNGEYHPQAREDYAEGMDHYSRVSADVAVRFFNAVRRCRLAICRDPEASPFVDEPRGIRSRRVDGFPYKLEYRIDAGGVFVLSVKHDAQHPAFGRDRK